MCFQSQKNKHIKRSSRRHEQPFDQSWTQAIRASPFPLLCLESTLCFPVLEAAQEHGLGTVMWHEIIWIRVYNNPVKAPLCT